MRSSTLQTNKVITLNNLPSPGATIPPTNGYTTNTVSPSGASTTTYSRIKGLPGGVWSAASKAAVGDGTDNAELQNRVTIVPADCASLTFDSFINQSQAQFNANGNSGSITVNAKATAGTALWLRGFEFTGSMSDVPIDDPDTVQNESIEYLKVNGIVKFETLVLGPFEFGGSNSCPLIVPFTLSSSNLENLVFASDAAVLSLPLVIVCPPSKVVGCDESFSYPSVQYAGCGNINITYNPAPPAGGLFSAGAFPVGVTPVTATATDGDGNSTSCTFTVTVTDTIAPVAPVLPTLTGESSVTVPQPTPAIDNCGGTVTASTTDPLIYTNQGTFTVHWKFDDGHGNTNTANQTVIVDDVTPPVPPTIPDAIGQCGAAVTVTAPTAIDAVVGPVIGTTSSPLTYTNLGTNTIIWTFNDGNGNTSTATQKVVVVGLNFVGFYSPIGGTGGTCRSPLVTAKVGSKIPLKFDILCGTTLITSGTPPQVKIQAYSNQCDPGSELVSVPAEYQNDWHYNWDTTGWATGTYRAVIVLPDGTTRDVFIKLK